MNAASYAQATGQPPIIAIDLNAPFPEFQIDAAAAWPLNKRRRDQALVTYAANLIHTLEHKRFRFECDWRGGQTPRDDRAQKAIADRAADCAARCLSSELGKIERDVIKRIGLGVLAEAPGVEKLSKEMDRADTKTSGFSLYVISCMAKFHNDMPASLTRAWWIVDSLRSTVPLFPINREQFFKLWSKQKIVAPLLAGRLFAKVIRSMCADRAANMLPFSWHSLRRVDEAELTLGLAKGFRRFATTHIAKGAKTPLILDSETAHYDSTAKELDLAELLLPISQGWVHAARGGWKASFASAMSN